MSNIVLDGLRSDPILQGIGAGSGTMTSAPANYAAWPTANDVQVRLAAAGVSVRGTALTDRLPNVLLEVQGEIARRTLRQFVADAVDETRTYNGNDTAELEVDEMVSLTSITIVGMQYNPGYPLANPQLVFEQNKPMTRIVVGVGSVPAWTTEGVWMPYRAIFPAGRQNILVTGRFGFAASIPTDLWNAVCGEMAYRLAKEAIFDPAGRVSSWRGGDEAVTLSQLDVDNLGWHGAFEAKMGLYKRPAGRRLRGLVPRMV